MDLYAQADQFRAAAARRERQASSDLVRAYGQAWQRLQLQLAPLAREIETERKAGRQVSPSWLFQEQRLNNLLREVEAELREFARFAEDVIVNEQAVAVQAAQANAAALVETQLAAARPAGVLASFQRLPKEALNDLVGFLSDGTPLRALLDQLPASGSMQVRQALIQGVASGANPRAIARGMKEALGGDLDRALRISRTEVLRSYRESSIRGFQENADVVDKWRWTATRTTRTCAMCIAMDGQEFPVTVHFGSHPNCRCTPVPVVKSYAELLGDPSLVDDRPKRDTGPEWFAKLPEDKQKEVLGPGKLELYRSGQLALDDLVGYREDKKWGPVRWERSLKVLQ